MKMDRTLAFLLLVSLLPSHVNAGGSSARFQPKEANRPDLDGGAYDEYAMNIDVQRLFHDSTLREGIISLSDFFVDGNVPSSIEVQFFSDEEPKTFQKVMGHNRDADTYYWYGEESDKNESSLNLIAKTDDTNMLRITGSASIGVNVYNIITLPDGSMKVREADISTFPLEGQASNDAPKRFLRNNQPDEKSANIMTERDLQYGDDDGSVIDVMCLYTPDALCDEVRALVTKSGTTCDPRNQSYIKIMDDKCLLGVEETNIAYRTSGVLTSLNLVYSGLIENGYQEMSDDICGTLDLMRSSNDATYRRIRQMRESYRADLVTLMVSDKSWCGCGDTFDGDSSSAYSVVNNRCATGYYSFGHEIGHALGCEHNRTPDLKGFGFGYKDPDENFRTIMSYNCDSHCPRIQRFSTPNNGKRYTGLPIGTYVHDNVRQINENRFTVANYRKSKQSTTKNPTKAPTASPIASPVIPDPTVPVDPVCLWNKVGFSVELETDGLETQQDISWTVVDRKGKIIASDSNSIFTMSGSENFSIRSLQSTYKTCILSGDCYSFKIGRKSGGRGKYRYKVFVNGNQILSGDNTETVPKNFSLDSRWKRYWMGAKNKKSCKWLGNNKPIERCAQYKVVRDGCPVTCGTCA